MSTGFCPLGQLEIGDHFSWEHTPERVFVVMGIMGTDLFVRRVGGIPHDTKITLNYGWKQQQVRRVQAPKSDGQQKCISCRTNFAPDGRSLCGSCQRAEQAAAPA